MCAVLAIVTEPEIPLSNNPDDFSADLFKSGIAIDVKLRLILLKYLLTIIQPVEQPVELSVITSILSFLRRTLVQTDWQIYS